MAQSAGPTTAIRHEFALSDKTVAIDWRQFRSNAETEDASTPKPSQAPDVPGKGTATFHRMIEELEARYTGKKGSTEGYDSDGGFLADEEEDADEEDDEAVSPEDFYVTTGPEKQNKGKRSYSEIGAPDGEETQRKRRKLKEELGVFGPELREAVMAFDEQWTTVTKGVPQNRFPPELETSIASVGQVAMAHHPKGYISSDIIEVITGITGFSSASLKHRLRGEPKKPNTSAQPSTAAPTSTAPGATAVPTASITTTEPIINLSQSAHPSSTRAEAIAFLEKLGGDAAAAVAIEDDAARATELHRLIEVEISAVHAAIREFTNKQKEPPKRSPWNDTIKHHLKILFALNDACDNPPVTAPQLRGHVLAFWPPNWEVKESQIRPLTRYIPPKPRAKATAEETTHETEQQDAVPLF